MAKSGKPGLKTRKVWLVQPGLNPGKPWFNQAFGARVMSHSEEILVVKFITAKEVLASCWIQVQAPCKKGTKLPAWGRKKKFLPVHYFWAVRFVLR